MNTPHKEHMAASTTINRKNWKAGDTMVIRVPRQFADQLLEIAVRWDSVRELKAASSVKRLHELSTEANKLRRESAISTPGEILYFAELGITNEREVRVIADGFGGAKLVVTEGPFEFDCYTLEEKEFSSETKACKAAEVYVKKARKR